MNLATPVKMIKTFCFSTRPIRRMEAESAIIDGGFWCDVVPRPPDAMTGLCGLAIEVFSGDIAEIRVTLGTAGIPFEIYRPEVEAH